MPRESITWHEARAFCTEKRDARLLTEAEWEYSARGPEGLIYRWGNEFETDALNCEDTSPDQVFPIGSFPEGVSWVEAYDLSGNVWEWTSTLYQEYPIFNRRWT